MVPFEEIEAALCLKEFFPDVDRNLIILAFNRRQMKSKSIKNSIRKYGIIKANYQEIEFLGDCMLSVIVKNILFQYYDVSLNALQMTQIVSKFVSNAHLAELTHKLKISQFVEDARCEKDYADVLEAIIGALYRQYEDLKLISMWFRSLSAVKSDPILFNDELIPLKIEVVEETEETEVSESDEPPPVAEEEILTTVAKMEVKEPKKPKRLKQPKGIDVKEMKSLVVHTHHTYFLDYCVPSHILQIPDPKGLYKIYADKYIITEGIEADTMTDGMVGLFKSLYNEEKRNIKDVNDIKRFTEKFRRRHDPQSTIKVNVGRNEIYSKIFHKSDGWYGISIDFERKTLFHDDPEMSFTETCFHPHYRVEKGRFKNIKEVFKAKAQLLKELKSNNVERENLGDVDLLKYSNLPMREGIIKLSFFISPFTPIKEVFENNVSYFIEEIFKPPGDLVNLLKFENRMWKKNNNIIKVMTSLSPLEGPNGFEEALKLEGGVVYPLRYEDIRHLLPDLNLTQYFDNETISKGDIDHFYQKIFMLLRDAGLNVQHAKLPLYSAVKHHVILGSFIRIIKDSVIYEIPIVIPSFARYFNPITGVKTPIDYSTVYQILSIDTVLDIWGLEGLSIRHSYQEYEMMVPPMNILYTKLTSPKPLAQL